MPFDLGFGAVVWMAVACLVAGFVRGYSGFGYSAMVIAASSLVMNPLNMVAVVSTVDNPMLAANPELFSAERFWPPYDRTANNLMLKMSTHAMRARSLTQ